MWGELCPLGNLWGTSVVDAFEDMKAPFGALSVPAFSKASVFGPLDGTNTVLLRTASGSGESPNDQTIATWRTLGGQCWTKHTAANCHQTHWKTMA